MLKKIINFYEELWTNYEEGEHLVYYQNKNYKFNCLAIPINERKLFTGIAKQSDRICYFKNGLYHRDDGPAIEQIDGSIKIYYQNGKRHRLDGPAMINYKTNFWFYKGKLFKARSQKEFEKLIKLKLFW